MVRADSWGNNGQRLHARHEESRLAMIVFIAGEFLEFEIETPRAEEK